jgi:hypothetical protein
MYVYTIAGSARLVKGAGGKSFGALTTIMKEPMVMRTLVEMEMQDGWYVLDPPRQENRGYDSFIPESGTCRAFRCARPTGPHFSDRDDALICLSVRQVHSMNIIKISVREDGGHEISELSAHWEGQEYRAGGERRLFSWEPGEFVRRWPEILEIEADGLLTNDSRFDLAVTVADCMPIFVSHGPWRALLHSGWAGTGILRTLFGPGGLDIQVSATVSPAGSPGMQQSDGSEGQPEEQQFAVFGPCISVANYQVDPERADLYRARFGPAAARGRYLDLRAANQVIAGELGLVELYSWDRCTVSHSGLFSYRQDGPPGLFADAGEICRRSQTCHLGCNMKAFKEEIAALAA